MWGGSGKNLRRRKHKKYNMKKVNKKFKNITNYIIEFSESQGDGGCGDARLLIPALWMQRQVDLSVTSKPA